jgi:hypothetical protein
MKGMEYATLVMLNPANSNSPTPLTMAMAAERTPPTASNGRERTHDSTQQERMVYTETTMKHGPSMLNVQNLKGSSG